MSNQNEKKLSLPRRLLNLFFSPSLDFRVRLFHVLAMGGTLISMIIGVVAALNHAGILNVLMNFFATVLSFAILMYSQRTGRYQLCYFVTIIGIFIGVFPFLFFSSGGYHSGMPSFFVFAVVFTVFMLEGKKAVFLSAFETLFYVSLCITAYLRPEWVISFEREQEVLMDTIIGIVTVSAVLGICLYLHFRLYNRQQKQLDEQNAILSQISQRKSEFLSNTSHEMRTPLTVISVNVQTVMEILDDMGVAADDPETGELLQSAQNEIMRLSRMVGGMLTLASLSENSERQELDLSSLLQNAVEMLRLNLDKRCNTVETNVEKALTIFGSADLLTQVLTNILQNAGTHTENGTITVSAKRNGSEITVAVQDTGSGISPELLPYAFERGATTGGTGFGLFLCKTVIESHGGKIWIESKLGKGTSVYYTLPVYEGQFGGAKI